MPSALRLAASFAFQGALLGAIVASSTAGCGGGEFPALVDSGPLDAGVDASFSVVSPGPDAAPLVDASADGAAASCAGQFTGTVTAVSGQQYGSCAACVEAACQAVLATCFADCSCGDDLVTLFGCLQSGGTLGTCAVAVTADFSASAESEALAFVACASTCGSSCMRDGGTDSDAHEDAGPTSDAGDAGDSGAGGSP